MFSKDRDLDIVVSAKELEAIVTYLKGSPHSKSQNEPSAWTRQRVLLDIATEIGKAPKLGKLYQFYSGVYGVVHHFGTDFIGTRDNDTRLQVWVLIRPESNPNHFIDLRTQQN